jgi:hypothetical protein
MATERIGISIPQELHERLSRFKDGLNISKICQEGINHAVRIEEIKADAPDIDSLVERLKGEELKYGKKYIEEGFEWGIKDAFSHLSLDDFLLVESRREDDGCHKWHEDDAPFFPSEETIKAFDEFDERTSVLGNDGIGSDERCLLIDQTPGIGWMLEPKHYFFRGWLNGIYHIWDKVKDKLIALDQKPEQLSAHIDDLITSQERSQAVQLASEDDEN